MMCENVLSIACDRVAFRPLYKEQVSLAGVSLVWKLIEEIKILSILA